MHNPYTSQPLRMTKPNELLQVSSGFVAPEGVQINFFAHGNFAVTHFFKNSGVNPIALEEQFLTGFNVSAVRHIVQGFLESIALIPASLQGFRGRAGRLGVMPFLGVLFGVQRADVAECILE